LFFSMFVSVGNILGGLRGGGEGGGGGGGGGLVLVFGFVWGCGGGGLSIHPSI